VVKVLDFGIAKFLGAPKSAHLQTQAGFVVGTPAYMSPEQVLGKRVDHRSDLWQMGIIAFECITGQRPFDGEALGQLFMTICSGPIPVPSAVVMPGAASIPPELLAFDAWFARAAHRDPAQRFASAGEMAEALSIIFAPGGVGESAIPTVASANRAEPTGPLATGRNDAWSTGRLDPPRPPPTPLVLIAGLLLAPTIVLAAGGIWWWASSRRAADVVPLSSAAPASAPAPSAAPTAAPEPTAAQSASAAPTASAGAAAPRKPPPAKPVRPGKKQETDRIGL
jgi:serine/threonine-protein kinase